MEYEKELTPEQLERLSNCKTPEEEAQFIEEEGRRLSEEDLDLIAGGKTDWVWVLVKIGYGHARWVLRKKEDI